MQKCWRFVVVLVVLFLASAHVGLAADPPVAGVFSRPYYEDWTWPCGSSGWVAYGDPRSHQYHMQYYDVLGKYHMGEDWNGVCEDTNAPLRAIADGKVVYVDDVDDNGKGKQLYIRHTFPYAKEASGFKTFDSVLLHVNGFEPLDLKSGDLVARGEQVAFLGGTGGWTPHLHWEVQWDITLPLTGSESNPYQQPLTIAHALRYRPPSLIVDDRRDEQVYLLLQDRFSAFLMTGNAPSSTLYIEWNNEKKTLKQAMEAGWLPPWGVLFEENGEWWCYLDPDNNFFEHGRRYAIIGSVPGALFHMPIPGNRYQQDRARLDMLHAVEGDSRFERVFTETYEYVPDWISGFDLHKLAFRFIRSPQEAWLVYANQLTRKSNPLERFTTFFNPDLEVWMDWKAVDRNQLY